jgi:hypothetical protein
VTIRPELTPSGQENKFMSNKDQIKSIKVNFDDDYEDIIIS